MQKIAVFLCFFLSLGVLTAFGQTESKEIPYNGNVYNAFVLKVDPNALKSFEIFENTHGLKHEGAIASIKSFIDSVSFNNSFFLSNASIVTDSCLPIGLFVDEYVTYQGVNANDGTGNFYLKPNGALLIKDNEAVVCKTADVGNHSGVRIGIQSGPMLVHDGTINAHFTPGSANKHIRSGVGMFTNNSNQPFLVFAISQQPVSFFDFSEFFLQAFNCSNALCIESARSVMTIPYLNTLSVNSQQIVCRYLYHK